MKISKLIETLKEIEERDGDIAVIVEDPRLLKLYYNFKVVSSECVQLGPNKIVNKCFIILNEEEND